MPPRFSRTQIIRLGRLLDMLYKPSEIAEEIGLTTDTIYRMHVPGGCPVVREGSKVWIHGVTYRRWVEDCVGTQKMNKTAMGENQAYCMACREAVDMEGVTVKKVNSNLELLQGKCAKCGAKVNRARKAGGND